MKRAIKTTALAVMLALGSVNVHASGIPTFDGAAVGNQINTWMIEAQRWLKQLKQYEQDFKNQQQQLMQQSGILQGLTGVRDIAGFIKDVKAELKNITDLNNWLNRSDDILKHGQDILGGNLKAIFKSYGLDSLCKNLVASQQKACEGEIIVDVIKQEQNRRDLEKVQTRISTIENIAKQMKVAKDSKQAQDLSNAMQTQIALLQADKLALDVARSNEELAKSKAEKQKRNATNKIMLQGMTNHKL